MRCYIDSLEELKMYLETLRHADECGALDGAGCSCGVYDMVSGITEYIKAGMSFSLYGPA
jgi:hypothetical protein